MMGATTASCKTVCAVKIVEDFTLIPVYLSLVQRVWESLMAYTSVESIPKSRVGPHASIWRAVLLYTGSCISQVLVPSGASIPGSGTLVSLKFWLRFRFFSTCSAPVTGFNVCIKEDSTWANSLVTTNVNLPGVGKMPKTWYLTSMYLHIYGGDININYNS